MSDPNIRDETKAEAEVATAIRISKAAAPDDMISGLGPSKGIVHLTSRPAAPKSQYQQVVNDEASSGTKPLLLTYFLLQGLGEVIRLILAETQTPYECIAVVGGEDQSVAMQWRRRSPNGLLPILSGWGVPRSQPLSQSRSIIKFLSKKLGLDGGSEDMVAQARVEILFETAKDLSDKKGEICDVDPVKDYSVAKAAFSLGKRIEVMLENMPSPKDETTILNYGQIQLFHVLDTCEARRVGCVKENLGDTLATFYSDMANRSGLKEYLQSAACVPLTHGELGQDGGYNFASGPLRRRDIKF